MDTQSTCADMSHVSDESSYSETETVCPSTAPLPPRELEACLLQDTTDSFGFGQADLQCRSTLVGEEGKDSIPEFGLLGKLSNRHIPTNNHTPIYLNVHDPFCFVTVGVQGSGKSHSLAVIVENCVLRSTDEVCNTDGTLRLHTPMSSLVFHYDQNQRNQCETIGIIHPSDRLRSYFAEKKLEPLSLPRQKTLVIVSPSNYHQRKAYYGSDVRVEPLLFSWGALSAKQIKCIMRINDGENQLYVSTMLSLLRKYQRKQCMPPFVDFCNELTSICSASGQNGPLRQRLALLDAFMKESDVNKEFYRDSMGGDLSSLMQEGMMVVADLTDPLLSPEEANGIFEVLLDQFRSDLVGGTTKEGKLLVLDEAHRYVSGAASDGLSKSIIDAVRLMRHEGLRVAISTQSPKILAPELLELVSLMTIHRFHSEEWYNHLKSKVPLPPGGFDVVLNLQTGQALVFAAGHQLEEDISKDPLLVTVRARFTQDLGASVTNAGCLSRQLVKDT